jgi:2-polyprenyl-3-methyl-5-hydroxy-6-metoxy-1,4-benzoquinol methylase
MNPTRVNFFTERLPAPKDGVHILDVGCGAGIARCARARRRGLACARASDVDVTPV